MYKRHIIGKCGENIAIKYLKENNYKIIEKNFLCKQGEIDIICTNGEYIIFTEVKTRSNFLYGRPSEAVNKEKQKHMYKAAKYYLYLHKMDEYFVRFDVIEIYISKNKYKINHIKQIM